MTDIVDLFDTPGASDYTFDADTATPAAAAGLTIETDTDTLLAVAAVAAAINHTTHDDIANWQTSQTYATDVFALRGDQGDYGVMFVWNADNPLKLGWYKELGRGTVMNRRPDDGELHQLVTECVAAISATEARPIPDTLEVYLYGYEHRRTLADIITELEP